MATTTATEKAFLLTEDSTKIPCLFNPSQLEIWRANGWAADIIPGNDVPTLRYTGAGSGWLRVELFFDGTDTGESVATSTEQILKLMEPDPDLPGADPSTLNVRPQTVTFHWGDLHSFPAVISDANLTFSYFASDGTPLRARLLLTLRQYEKANNYGPQNPTSGTPTPHRVHRVQPGETLDRISAQYYGDPNRWRMLAQANGIEDPLAMRPGSLLAIPRIDGS